MPYPALPAARRIHYEVDGTVLGWNGSSNFGSGMQSVASAGQRLSTNEETPAVNGTLYSFVANGQVTSTYFVFPSLMDLTNILIRGTGANSPGGTQALPLVALQSSVDTTNGADGTWASLGFSGTPVGNINGTGATSDWWRSTAPATFTSNNAGIKGVRFQVGGSNSGVSLQNVYLWGEKSSGQTPNDIVFLKSDDATEWPSDDDFGDVPAGTTPVVHQAYVQNSSPSLNANTITVKSSGSDSSLWTVSLDGVSYSSSVSISSLAPGASTLIYYRFNTPASGLRPYAGYLEADVVSWS